LENRSPDNLVVGFNLFRPIGAIVTINRENLQEVAAKAVRASLEKNGALPQPSKKPETLTTKLQEAVVQGKKLLQEALILIPKTFVLKTDWLSDKTKEAHEKLYKNYIAQFNQASAELDTVSREDIIKLRSLKLDETYALNATKLHELYFGNISDQQSEIHRDSIPYMRLGRDWGTFENWQFDFRGTALAAREGWVVLYFDPFKEKYLHAMIDGHTENIPVCGIPILVLDMWSHAYYKDYLDDKKSYVNAMMREINWQIVEARMVIAERANLKDLYLVRPLVNNVPQKMIDQASNTPPIGKDQVAPGGVERFPAPGSDMQVNPRPMVGAQQTGGKQ
jgi:Fe-Mn family superoxide dismutase